MGTRISVGLEAKMVKDKAERVVVRALCLACKKMAVLISSAIKVKVPRFTITRIGWFPFMDLFGFMINVMRTGKATHLTLRDMKLPRILILCPLKLRNTWPVQGTLASRKLKCLI